MKHHRAWVALLAAGLIAFAASIGGARATTQWPTGTAGDTSVGSVMFGCENGSGQWVPATTTGQCLGSGGGGPYQYQSAGASQSQLSVTTSAVVTPTIPTGTTAAILGLRSGAASAVNYCYDGLTTPTTGTGGACLQLSAGQTVSIQGAALLAGLKMIAATATTAVDIAYVK